MPDKPQFGEPDQTGDGQRITITEDDPNVIPVYDLDGIKVGEISAEDATDGMQDLPVADSAPEDQVQGMAADDDASDEGGGI